MKLNLGSGFNKLPGYINVDKAKNTKPDILADLTVVPWKWAKSNTGDLILADNLAEHIYPLPWVKVVRECHRVLKKGAPLRIRVPETRDGNLMAMYSDPTHVNRNFTWETFDYYNHKHTRWKNYGRAYGIPRFEKTKQIRKGRFLVVELRAVK